MLPRSSFVWLFALTLCLSNAFKCTAAAETAMCATPPPGLIHWYRAEGDANDSIGTRHAILQNGASFGPGKVGQAFQLDGANDYVDLGNWFDLQVFTIAMWVKAGATQQTYADIMDNNHTDSRSWVIQYQNTGLQFIWGVAQRGSVNFSLTPDTWQFLVVNFDANYVGRVYLDGELKGSFQGNGPVNYDGTQFCRLSAWGGGGRFFNGEIDEVDIYDRALAQAEVLALFQAGSAGKCVNCDPTPDGIASWWSFEGNGNDSVGSKTVTLKNGAVFAGGKVGQGLQLDGADDYAEAPADSQWRFGTNDFTIELWAKFNSIRASSSLGNPAAVFAASDDGGGPQNKWLFDLGGSTLNFHINGPSVGAKFLALAPFEPVLGRWYHVAVTRDAIGYRIFTNGTQIGFEANSDAVPDASAPLTIGQAEGLGFMDGSIDELAIYRRALSATEIQKIFAAGESGKCGPSSGLPDLQIARVTAPNFALPGNPFEISVTVTNSGTALAPGNWLSGLYLSTDSVFSNDDLFVGDAIVPSALAPGASMVITQTVTAPLITSEFFLIVAADSDNRISEQKEANNWLAATNTITVPAGLHLALSSDVLNEDDTNDIIRATVSRSGAAATALVVSLTATPQGQIVMPPQVTIPAGESSATFTISAMSDDLPEGRQTISLSAQAADITDARASLVVTDADKPHLFLEIPAQTLMEGSSVTGIVRRDFVTTNDVVVLIANSDPARLVTPLSVTIPKNLAQSSFMVAASENTIIEPNATVTLTASAPSFQNSPATITVVDNDAPSLTFKLALPTVSESAGGLATVATLTRSPITAQPLYFTVQRSNPKAIVPATVVIAAFEAEATFAVGVRDNAVVDNNQSVTISATMVNAGTTIPVGPVAKANLEVTDDESPALGMTVSKPSARAGTTVLATVTRNGVLDSDLVVTLTSSNPTEATVPATITIPAGASSTSFEITVLNGGVANGNQRVTITASCANFSKGVASITVTETDLPDLAITAIQLPANALNDGSVQINYTIANLGGAPFSGVALQRVSISNDGFIGDDTVVGYSEFSGSLAPGQQTNRTFTITTPLPPADYWIIVEADATKLVTETLENNNAAISRNPMSVRSAYFATIQTAIDIAPANTAIPLNGVARGQTGGPMPFVPVSIFVDTAGTRRVISATSGSDGTFTATFQPLPGEAGHYRITASHPTVTNTPPQDTFTLVGMRIQPERVSHRIASLDGVTNTVTLVNSSDVPLTALNASVVGSSTALDVSVDLPTEVQASATIPFTYRIRSIENQAISGMLIIHVSSAEGATADLPIDLSVLPPEPNLVVKPATLSAGMIRGSQSILEFSVINQGGAESGPIDVALPAIPWLHVATALPLPNLLPGQTNKVLIQLTPAPDLPLGPNTGTLLVSSARSRTAVPFSFVSLSSAVGDLRVSVEDEFTYYAAGSPKVTNASVTLRDHVTTETVTNGFTGADGKIFFGGLREAFYDIEVTADKHTTFRRTLLVSAGKENDVTAFISRQAVQYIWTVTPTTIEDRTRITIQTIFETVVPMPVITIDPPYIDLGDIKGDAAQVDVKITNHGLIAAQEMNLSFPSHPAWQIQPLITSIGALAAQQTMTVPVLIRRITAAAARPSTAKIAQSPPAVGPCVINGTVDWSLLCGGQKNKYGASISAINANPDCLLGGGAGTPGGTSSPGQSGATGFLSQPTTSGPGVSSIAFFPPEPPILEQKFSCGPCDEKTFEPESALSIDISGLFSFIAPVIEGAIEAQTGGFVHPDVTIKAEGGIRTCCKEGNQGYEVYGSATAGLELGVGPVFEKDASLTVTLESNPPVEAKVSGKLKFGIELSGGLSLSGDVSSGCGTGTEVTASATVDVGFFAGITGEVKAEIEGGPFSGEVKPVSLDGSLNGHASLTLTYAHGSFTTKVCSEGIYYTAMGSVLGKTFNLFSAEKNYIVDPYCPGGAERALFIGDLEKAALEEIQKKYVPVLMAKMRAAAPGPQTFAQSSSVAAAPVSSQTKAASEEGVCARVRLRLDQDLVMTRNAFNATLELINNNEGVPLENINVQVNIVTTNGVDANNLFGVRSPHLAGALTAVDGTGTLPGPSSGKSSWILIPTNEAAPDGPTQYAVGGLLTYMQEGHQVVVPLAPVSITVFPDASLRLKYFHQRDVLSDDPFTPLIEPAEPFVLGVLVQNSGKGEAKNVRITSAQPKIVDNEKGLLIDFKIIGAQVGTNAVEPSLTVNFGNIAPGGIGVGKWLLQSSLQGQFIDYQASFEHIDELGDPRLSLVQGVEIHELIRSVQADGAFEDGLPDFLVNDVANGENLPDTLYLSDGRIMPVAVNLGATTDKTPTAADLVVHLTTSSATGWTYFKLPDPARGSFRLARVQRSDGRDLTVGTNAWVTDRTFIENSHRPINEWNVHLLDYDSTGSYTLYYQTIPSVADATPPVSSVTPLDPFNAQQFTVSWSGRDELGGSGIAAFDVYVSVNGGAFTPWLAGTHLTAGVFQGIPGNRYAFYSVATDAAGNREPAPTAGQAQTEVTGNTAPAIANIADITIVEGQTLRTTIAATDAEHDTIQFALGEAPPGMSIDSASGELKWITGEAHGPATYNVSIQAQDSGSPRLISTRSFHVTVLETNSPPVLPAIPSAITVVEGARIVIDAGATDPDLPANPLQYSLAPGAPTGAAISSAGLFTWTPSEAQGGTTNTITIIVNDGRAPNLTDTRAITVVVLDQNSPPVITPIPDQLLYEGDTLALTIGVTDPDIPANILTLSLPSGAPDGVIFDAAQHTLKWSPTAAQAPSTNIFTIRATDNGQPPLNNTVSFQVEVVELKPGLNTPKFATDGAFEFRFKGSQGDNYVLQSSPDLFLWTDLFPFTATNWVIRLTDVTPHSLNHRFYRVKP